MNDKATIINGNCIDEMKKMAEASVDAIVTDPPYGLEFMGKEWDHGVPGKDFWVEALRVAKPGTHLLAFGGTRTYHRLACAIEDAGWEIRDCVMWVYGSGFPKSHNVACSIDKSLGHPNRGKAIPTASTYQASDVERKNKLVSNIVPPYEPKSDLAKPWDGWGTALKPAWEPIIIARKPLIGTVAENVLKHGTGATNIDGCRVGTEQVTINTFDDGMKPFGNGAGHPYSSKTVTGRWPANFVHDGSDDVVKLFPDSKSCDHPSKAKSESNIFKGVCSQGTIYPGERGSAARFFYCSKANKSDKGKDNIHPTVKPTDLMRYLCRLVTPPNGIVLDPFMGSGSTGKAALLEGFRFVGIELSEEYANIARKRLDEIESPSSLMEIME